VHGCMELGGLEKDEKFMIRTPRVEDGIQSDKIDDKIDSLLSSKTPLHGAISR
jgi:hypothetical protein